MYWQSRSQVTEISALESSFRSLPMKDPAPYLDPTLLTPYDRQLSHQHRGTLLQGLLGSGLNSGLPVSKSCARSQRPGPDTRPLPRHHYRSPDHRESTFLPAADPNPPQSIEQTLPEPRKPKSCRERLQGPRPWPSGPPPCESSRERTRSYASRAVDAAKP